MARAAVTGTDRDTAGAFIQNGKLGLVVEEASHAKALLFPQAQQLTPVHLCPQPLLPVHQVL